MPARLGLCVLSLVLVAGCAARADCPQPVPPAAPSALPSSAAAPHEAAGDPATPAAPVLVLMVRHAEKSDDGTPDPPLTERGRERAACLAALLQGFEPTHLFATPYQRNRATVEPLAAVTGLTPTLIDPNDRAAWQRALRELPPASRAVVVGHSNSLPALVASLGARLTALDPEGNLPHDEHDRLVHVVVYGPGHATAYDTRYCTAEWSSSSPGPSPSPRPPRRTSAPSSR